MNYFYLIFIVLFATAINADARNCKKGKPCGGSCISMDKECHVGELQNSSSTSSSSLDYSSSTHSPSGYSSESSSPIRIKSYSYSGKIQISYECNGTIVSESEFQKCKSLQQDSGGDDKKLTTVDSDENNRTNSPKTKTAVVAEVLYADIVQCIGKKQQKIRLYGIDAPEDGQPFYQEAKDMLRNLLYKKKITVKIYSQDSNGIDMAVVLANGKNINESMIQAGLAWIHTGSCTESFCEDWIESEEDAKSQGKGLWSDSGRIPPWVWK